MEEKRTFEYQIYKSQANTFIKQVHCRVLFNTTIVQQHIEYSHVIV